MERDDLAQLARKHGLGDAADEIAAAARVAIVLDDAGPAGGEAGTTHLGGLPDLPADAEWPVWRGRPLTLVAQIRLEDSAELDEERLLPPAGLLSFFWDSAAVAEYAADVEADDAAGWGFDPADAGSARVLYTADAAAVSRRDRPDGLPAEAILNPRAATPRPRLTIPPWESTDFELLGLEDTQTDAYFELARELARVQAAGDAVETTHQLLGYPDQIQGDMQLESHLVTHGLYCGDGTGYADPRAAELEPGAREWRLLLQIGSDVDGLGVMWADGGRIYYWTRGRDLAERRFDAAWLVFQCS